MSTVTNKAVKMCCKEFMAIFKIVIGIIVELSVSIAKPKGYLKSYTYIR